MLHFVVFQACSAWLSGAFTASLEGRCQIHMCVVYELSVLRVVVCSGSVEIPEYIAVLHVIVFSTANRIVVFRALWPVSHPRRLAT